MHTTPFSHARPPHLIQERDRPTEMRDALLLVCGALAVAAVLFTVALVSDRLVFNDAVVLEPVATSASLLPQALAAGPPVADDPFHQHKLDAKVQELPTQF